MVADLDPGVQAAADLVWDRVCSDHHVGVPAAAAQHGGYRCAFL
jgi:hypothetical protein